MEDYKIIKRIDNGGYGEVFKVENKKTHCIYAMKTIDVSGTTETLFSRETQILRELNQLDHKNIVKYIDCFFDDIRKKYVIVMEYCKAGNLADIISKQKGVKLTEEQVISFLWDIAQGLKYIHEKKIVHRDLKPKNILMGDDARIKICDFGISRVLACTYGTTPAGTLEYMSPEMRNFQPYGLSTDIWSLGCIAYELCSLKPLFDRRIIAPLVDGVSSDDFDPNMIDSTQYSEELRALISSMLSIDKANRPTAMDIVGSYVITKHLVPQMYFFFLRMLLKNRFKKPIKDKKTAIKLSAIPTKKIITPNIIKTVKPLTRIRITRIQNTKKELNSKTIITNEIVKEKKKLSISHDTTDTNKNIETKIIQNAGLYTGEIKNGLPHGHGICTWPNGNKYVGQWENGKQNGSGMLLYRNGNRYEGSFKNGKISGTGAMYNGGSCTRGIWENNSCISKIHTITTY